MGRQLKDGAERVWTFPGVRTPSGEESDTQTQLTGDDDGDDDDGARDDRRGQDDDDDLEEFRGQQQPYFAEGTETGSCGQKPAEHMLKRPTFAILTQTIATFGLSHAT